MSPPPSPSKKHSRRIHASSFFLDSGSEAASLDPAGIALDLTEWPTKCVATVGHSHAVSSSHGPPSDSLFLQQQNSPSAVSAETGSAPTLIPTAVSTSRRLSSFPRPHSFALSSSSWRRGHRPVFSLSRQALLSSLLDPPAARLRRCDSCRPPSSLLHRPNSRRAVAPQLLVLGCFLR